MDATLYVVSMSQILKNYKLLFRTYIYMNKDIMYVDFGRHSQWFSLRLCCLQSFDYDISSILQELYFLKIACTTSCIIFVI